MSTCLSCKQPYIATRYKKQTKYCSKSCRINSYNKKVGVKGTGLPTGTTGAISELVIACDLLMKGYEVFRSLSPSCSCDLAILKDGKLLRIEVRTAYRNQINGNLMCPKPTEGKFDVLAMVVGGNEIIYHPPF